MGWFSSGPSYDVAKSQRCYVDHFVDKCGSCIYMSKENRSSSFFGGYKYQCLKKGSAYPWDDRTCYSYELMPADKRNYVEYYYEFTGRRYYYILTVICEVLGISLESDLYQEIKALIQLVRSDESTLQEAVLYDTFGPGISEDLLRDGNVVLVCKDLLTNYLSKVYMLIKQNNQEEAIEIYKNMVTFLYTRYKSINNQENLIDTYSLNQTMNENLVR